MQNLACPADGAEFIAYLFFREADRIMKSYILAVALVLASTSAMADRTVSGSESNRDSKATACESAKVHTLQWVHGDEVVESYSKCDCDQDSHGKWSCSVDARLTEILS